MAAPATVRSLRAALAGDATSAEAICASYLDRIRAHDEAIGAFLQVDAEGALAAAREFDRRSDRDTLPLGGIPVAVKDNICTRGVRTTAGSRILDSFVPPYDATVVTRLRDAGAVIVGKTNCDEFAMGSSTENSAFFPTKNPWDVTRSPGGSSGGSAAAVAADFAPIALGSDTGGSVRQPAAFCGVVGLKPTYGRVSRYGLIAFGSSLDQVGTFGHTVHDAAVLFDVIAGGDAYDSTTATVPAEPTAPGLDAPIAGLRLGVPRAMLREGVDPEVLAGLDLAIAAWQDAGATVVDIDLPHAAQAIPVYYLVAPAEASSNLARYDGVRYGFRAPIGPRDSLDDMYERTRDAGFGAEVKRRILIGTYVLSAGYYDAFYLKAQQVRTLIRDDYTRAFGRVDAVVMPTTPGPAFRLGEHVNHPLEMYLADVFTVSANLAGIPAVSVPCGLTSQRLPIGVQVLGPAFSEGRILQVAHALEARTTPLAR